MSIDKICSNCEFCFQGECGSHESPFGYGANLIELGELLKYNPCFEISFEYFTRLVDSLPDDVKNRILNDDSMGRNEIITFIENYKS